MAMDYEALDPVDFLRWPEGHTFTLTAEFPDLAAADRACRALRDAGFAADDVMVLGQLGDEVNTASGLAADERIVLGTAAWHIGIGAGAGALVGGALNLLVGLVTIGAGGGLWAALAGGLVFGALVGGLVGGVSIAKLVFSPAEAHRRHPELDHAVLGVNAPDLADLERVETALRGLAPVRIDRIEPATSAI